jgi:hypothetical protein
MMLSVDFRNKYPSGGKMSKIFCKLGEKYLTVIYNHSIFYFVVLGLELRALCLPGRCHSTNPILKD